MSADDRAGEVVLNIADVIHGFHEPHCVTGEHTKDNPCPSCLRTAGEVIDRLAAGGYDVVRPPTWGEQFDRLMSIPEEAIVRLPTPEDAE